MTIIMRYLLYIFFLSLCALPASGQSSFSPYYEHRADSLRTDSLRADSLSEAKIDKNKIKIIKRNIDYKKYIALAVAMMVYIALILTTVQTWNPG
jgi:hypothetical protein